MEFIKEIIIEKPADQVWEVLGNQYGEAYKWASGINHSSSYGKAELTQANCNNRTCELPSGKIEEVIRVFDPNNHVLEYEVIQGFPFFVESGVNHWELASLGSRTKVHMHLTITTKGIMGKVMGPMMKSQMAKATKSVLYDLKHYVETGKASPEKTNEMAKISRKAA